MAIKLKLYDAIIGIDPGLSGAISIMSNGAKTPEIFDAPTLKIANPNKKSKIKTKKDMDESGIVDIFSKLKSENVIVGLERVHAMPGQGNVSMFNFGVGYGIYRGIIQAFRFTLVEASPQSWKKSYSDLNTPEMMDLKQQISDLRKTLKLSKDKAIKKEIDKYNKDIKTLAKTAARELAAKLYPSLADKFKLKKHDGRAEALLICNFIKESHDK